VLALRNVSLTIEPGTIMAVLGPNGAGKTTLLRCLAGVMIPGWGSIEFDGKPFRRDALEERRRVLFLPDIPLSFPNMTVIQHVAMLLRLYQASPDHLGDRVAEHLEALDILTVAGAPLYTLSRGQSYKSALAALFSVDPELWLLDEPFASGMDPNGMAIFKQRARAAAAAGRIILYSTQILEIAESFCDRVCVIDRGVVRLDESVAALRERVGTTTGVLEETFRRLRENRQ